MLRTVKRPEKIVKNRQKSTISGVEKTPKKWPKSEKTFSDFFFRNFPIFSDFFDYAAKKRVLLNL